MSATPMLAAVARALALRAWALRVLAGEAGVEAPGADVPVDAWTLFLRAERCALPLRARLSAVGRDLPPALAAVLRNQATEEMKRFLSAAAQLRLAGAELARRGWTGVALKGGVAAAEGAEPVDVMDVDLLLERRHAAEFAAFLEREAGGRALSPDPGHAVSTWQLAARLSEGSVQVEVHYDVPMLGPGVSPWEGIRPTAIAGIHRPGDALHLWHLLVHSVVHHLERRGQLRELVLIRGAMDRCSPEALGQARTRMDAHPAAGALRAQWEMAAALRTGRAPVDSFRETAAARLAIVAGAGRALPEWLFQYGFAPCLFALAAGRAGSSWRGGGESVLPAAGFRGDTWLDRRLPAAAWAARVCVRAARTAAVYPAALRLHRQLGSIVRECVSA